MKANIYPSKWKSCIKRMACAATICSTLLIDASAQTVTTGTVYSNFPNNQAASNVTSALAPQVTTAGGCAIVGTVATLVNNNAPIQSAVSAADVDLTNYAELGNAALVGVDLNSTLSALSSTCVVRDYYELVVNLNFPEGSNAVAPGGYYAGFKIALPGVVGNLNLGSTTTVTTLLNGVEKQSTNGAALGLNLLGNGEANVQFQTTSGSQYNFNQLRIRFAGGITALAVAGAPPRVYYGYASPTQILPVKLTSFGAVNEGKIVRVNWTSATEANVSHYELERSATATGKFEKIGTVKAKGNSTTATSYSFNDNVVLSSEYFYRLKLVDKDGTAEYSAVASIRNLGASKFKVYPTLVTKGQNITVSTEISTAKTDIQLTNLQGQVVKNISTTNANIAIETGSLNAGVYVLKLYRNGQLVTTEKVVLQ